MTTDGIERKNNFAPAGSVDRTGWLRWRRVVALAVAAIVAGFVVATFLATRKPDTQDQDFGAYYRSGVAVRGESSPYVIDSHGPLGAYMYAPVFAYYPFRLLSKLPYLWAVRVFMLTNWIATAACVALCFSLTRVSVPKSPLNPESRRRDLLLVGLIALVPTWDYLKANLHNGQVGTLLLLACLSWLALMLADWRFLGGLILSLAVALKLYPALLVPYLLLRQDWRGLAGVAIGLLILFLSPVLSVGVLHLVPLHAEWLRFCFSTQVADQTLRTGNQSLLGALARLPFVSDGRQRHVSTANLAYLLKIYPLIVLSLTALLYGLILATRRHGRRRTATDAVADIALLLLWMTIASPRAWTFNFAVEILPATLLACAVVEFRARGWLAITALCAVLFALVFPTNNLHFSDRWNLPAYLVQNKHFDALLLLGLAVAIVVIRPDGRGREVG